MRKTLEEFYYGNPDLSSLSQAASTAQTIHGAIKTGKAIAAGYSGKNKRRESRHFCNQVFNFAIQHSGLSAIIGEDKTTVRRRPFMTHAKDPFAAVRTAARDAVSRTASTS